MKTLVTFYSVTDNCSYFIGNDIDIFAYRFDGWLPGGGSVNYWVFLARGRNVLQFKVNVTYFMQLEQVNHFTNNMTLLEQAHYLDIMIKAGKYGI